MSQPSPRVVSPITSARAWRRTVAALRYALCRPAPRRQEHPAEAREVVGGGEQPGVAGHAAQERARCRRAPRRGACPGRSPRWARCAAPRGRRPERRVRHAERRVEALARELVERLAAHAPHHLAQQDEAGVAVVEGGARRRLELRRGRSQARGLGQAAGNRVARAAGRGSPALWVSTRRTVTSRKRGPAELVQVAAERRVQVDPPVSQSASTAGSVATTLVSEATSKTVSSVTGSTAGHQRARCRRPCGRACGRPARPGRRRRGGRRRRPRRGPRRRCAERSAAVWPRDEAGLRPARMTSATAAEDAMRSGRRLARALAP